MIESEYRLKWLSHLKLPTLVKYIVFDIINYYQIFKLFHTMKIQFYLALRNDKINLIYFLGINPNSEK